MERRTIEFHHEDERGVFEQVGSGEWRQLNVLRTRRGHQRGGHYHKRTREFFYVLQGRIQLETKNVRTGGYLNLELGKGECCIVEPYESHQLTSLTNSIVLAMLSQIFDPNDTDIYPHW